MKHDLATALIVGAAALGAGAAIVFAPGDARADDITIDDTPFVSTMSRNEVKAILKAQPEVVRRAADEWARQGNQMPQVRSTSTRAEVMQAYIKDRRNVAALYAEDSGSNSPWVLKAPAGSAATMGAPAR